MTSLRLAAILMAGFALLLLLTVMVPQRRTIGDAEFLDLLDRNDTVAFALETLGLGSVATSPPFFAVVAFLLLVLICVIIDRFGVTLRRIRFRPPSEQTLLLRAEKAATSIGQAPKNWSKSAKAVLEGFGFAAAPVGSQAVWAVKHRYAILGFPVFHVSFLLIFAGGVQIYLTRSVAAVRVVEGQAFQTEQAFVVRQPLWGALPKLSLFVEQVNVQHEEGEVVHLGATISGNAGRQELWVNHPARFAATSILVTGAGLSPELWIQDKEGFTADRVAIVVNAKGGDSTTISLVDGITELTLAPLPLEKPLPSRDELAGNPVSIVGRYANAQPVAGILKTGERLPVGDLVVVLDDLRYWVALRIVTERGGGWLIAGFFLAVVGLIWRLVWFRREVAVTVKDQTVEIWGRSELYTHRFDVELEAIAEVLRKELATAAEEKNS